MGAYGSCPKSSGSVVLDLATRLATAECRSFVSSFVNGSPLLRRDLERVKPAHAPLFATTCFSTAARSDA